MGARGVLTGLRSITVTLLLLVSVTFMFAVIFIKIRTPSDEDCFEEVLFAMHCLMMQGIFADQAQMIQQMLSDSLANYLVFLSYLVIGSLGTLNLFIGVCVDVANTVSDAEERHLRENEAKETLSKLLKDIDV